MALKPLVLSLLAAVFISFFSQIAAVAQTPVSTVGKASFYAKYFHGRKTASGEIFSNSKMTCAHKTLPFGTRLKVTNLQNGKWVVVTVNDRGPFVKGRIADLSQAAAKELSFYDQGITTVRIEEITDENECALTHNHSVISHWFTRRVASVNSFSLEACEPTLKSNSRLSVY